MWRVLLVEAQRDFAGAVTQAMRHHEDLRLVATTDEGPQATRLAKVLKPDAILINIALCSHERFIMLSNIMSHTPTRVLVYASGQSAYDLALARAKQYGASGTCPHPPSGPEEVQAIVAQLGQLCASMPMPVRKDLQPQAPLGTPLVRGEVEMLTASPPALEPSQSIQTNVLPLPPKIVAVGASTGGPAAIETLMRRWPKDFLLPIVVAQHMTTGFNDDLVAWLSSLGSVRVKLAEDNEIMKPGTMYFAPDGHDITVVTEEMIRLTPAKDDDASVPNVDTLFHSVARVFGPSSIGVLLTGMGEDGAQGLLHMRRIGARTLVQNQQSSLVFGMPQAAIKLGAAQLVLGLEDIGSYVFDCQNALRRGKK
jgi:two-component system, chemotaxis family, protein-glutamate methylesterase/glutaminase